MSMPLNQMCRKCRRAVTERDFKVRNVDGAAIRLTGPADPAAIRGQLHWQHKVCPHPTLTGR